MVWKTREDVVKSLNECLGRGGLVAAMSQKILDAHLDNFVAFNQAIEKLVAEGYSETEALEEVQKNWDLNF